MTAAPPLEPAPDVPIAVTDTLRACLWVGIGSCIRGHLLFFVGLPVLLASFGLAWRVMWRVGGAHTASVVDRPIIGQQAPWLPKTCFWLAVMAVVGLAAPSTIGPLWFDLAKRAYFVLGLAVVGVFRYGSARQSTRAVKAVMVAATLLNFVTPVAVPIPDIDVWVWTQACLQALLQGVHPYTVDVVDLITNVYRLGPTATVYPYMPLTLVALAPAYALFGDYRVMLAVCVPATVALNRVTGRRLGLESRFIDASTLAFLLFPRGPWLTCYGWNEPLLVLVLSGFVYLATRTPGGAAQAVAFLLLPALKQYIVAPVLLFLAISRPRVSAAATAVTVAAATVVPFLIWDWRPTVQGIVVQMVAPAQPRLDSTSLVALAGLLTGVYVPRWISVGVQFLVAGVAYARLRDRGLGGLLLGSSLALHATFLTGWQAFMNYYYLIGEMLLLAAMVFAAARPSEGAVSGKTTR